MKILWMIGVGHLEPGKPISGLGFEKEDVREV